MEFLPQLERVFPSELLQHEAAAIGKCSECQIFLILDREGFEDNLFNCGELFLDVIESVSHDLCKLGDELAHRRSILLLLGHVFAKRLQLLWVIDQHVCMFLVLLRRF